MKNKDYSFKLEGTNGKGIILVHGLTGAPAEMKFVGKQLHSQGYTVYAPMLAGHCRDEAYLVTTKYEDWLDSLKTAIDSFSKEVDEVHMAGICVGGGLALYAAHQVKNKVKTVTIYSATLNYDGWSTPFYYKYAPYGIPLMVRIPGLKNINFNEAPPYGMKCERTRKAIVGKGDGIEGTLPSFPAKSLYQNYRLNSALAKALPKIEIPTLLIHAREDDVSHPRNATKIQKLHGGTCEIIYMEDSYHLIHVDKERKKVAAFTAEFMEKHSSKKSERKRA